MGLHAEPLCFPVSGTVWRTTTTAADNINAGLIVTGTRGNTGLRSLMQSSVADRVLRHGRRPVLIVSCRDPPENRCRATLALSPDPLR